ncbi:aminotransferase class I/II-fold pyridoxal phosphate-dependent enzyme [Microbacterium esteraromaticum]|uniref:Aminotransferase class I/II-fold pyridoxal phosphate-dependent enzyme n=1 Tax=Microbacterium esteraromaticum TaxID=57043 RepID=A0A7D8A8K1_9MICO|nr:aminotransferase class I/II-fold pyridoxal phosphate-dependent enzyme [Microbacterium esteraromaticum]QMU97160.1 aminotransferase class I/II-fold pyridoxal phosphate-dependent enzyme [Microbacterium esteraromaticum]
MLLATQVRSRTAKGIAAEIGRLITSGELDVATRLPAIRALADELEVSPTTVQHAYQALAQSGLVIAQGKRGTVVRGAAESTRPPRYAASDKELMPLWDLTSGTPDPALLPDVGAALMSLAAQDTAILTSGYMEQPVLPDLEWELRRRWPFEPGAITVVDGALDAIDRLFRLTLRVGDRVLVENPTFPPVLDMIERAGAEIIGLPLDEHGIVPGSLRDALEMRPSLLVLQPRAQNPSGVSMTHERAEDLAAVLTGSSVLIIEDDHAGGITSASQVSLGSYLPDRVIRILSFSKAFGPDLRLAAVGGAADTIVRLDNARALGPGWSSRLLQHVLLYLLTDERALAQLANARAVYAHRRRSMVEALRREGFQIVGEDGINIWVPVANENEARIRLAMRDAGIAVALGSSFLSAPLPSEFIRITCSAISEGFTELAGAIAAAALPPRARTSRPAHPR